MAAFLLIGSLIYSLISGVNLYASVLFIIAICGLGVPSVVSGEGILDAVAGFFEAFLDGVMELIGGIFDAISSIWG